MDNKLYEKLHTKNKNISDIKLEKLGSALFDMGSFFIRSLMATPTIGVVLILYKFLFASSAISGKVDTGVTVTIVLFLLIIGLLGSYMMRSGLLTLEYLEARKSKLKHIPFKERLRT